jgi:tRNA (guanine-N7-)-methyltransferase
MSDSIPTHDHIRSFVLRQGRMSDAQKRYLDEGLPRFGVPYAKAPVDFDTVFGRSAPRILEIGCGMGETTVAIAAAHPENDYLGIEVHGPGVGSLLKQISTQGLTNLRVIQHDAVEVLRDMIPPGALAGIQPPFVHQLASRLAPGGYLHCATDWEEYAQQMLEVLSGEALLDNTATDFAPRPAWRPQTKFETRGLRLGHGVWDVLFRRR